MLRRPSPLLRCTVLLVTLSTLTACTAASAVSALPGQGQGRPTVAVADLLSARADALLTHDTVALARTAADGAAPGVRELGARTAALPLTRYSFTLDNPSAGPRPDEQTVLATVHYRLDVDRSDATARRRLVLVDPGGTARGWRLLSDDPVGPALPWDLGVVTYARGSRGAALTTTSQAPAPLAAAADRAATAVTQVWGRGWDQAPVLVGVAGAADLARLTGRTVAGVAGLVALSTTDRVYVDLAAYARLSAAGRQVLVTHEVTHLATGAAADRAVPQWLKEGFADYVGFRGSGIAVSAAAASLLARVRASGAPATLPPDAAFDPGAGAAATGGYTEADAYSAAWLACTVVADRVGPGGLARVYRATSAGSGAGPSNVDAALRQVTGEPLIWWTQRWRADLTGLAR